MGYKTIISKSLTTVLTSSSKGKRSRATGSNDGPVETVVTFGKFWTNLRLGPHLNFPCMPI